MYFDPSRHEARAALAPEAEEKRAIAMFAEQKRQLDDPDPVASWLSAIFGGGDDEPTSTRRTTSTIRTTQGVLPTEPVVILTPTQRTTSTTRTTSTRPLSTAQVITTPRPIVNTSPSPVPNIVTLTSTAPNTANTGLTDASQSNSSSKSGLPSVVVGIIVAASVIFGLIFIALIARKFFQARRRNRRATWARNSIIAPFEAPPIQEKALPPPPPSQLLQNEAAQQQQYPSYPAYPPAAMTYAQQPIPYSPAAASSAGYPAPYPFGGSGNAPNVSANANAVNPFNASSYTPADLAGAPPIVIQQPATPLSAVPLTVTAATAASGAAVVSIVKRTFVPSLPDELSISNGDQVRVLSAYDDGWALCEKVGSGERGVVPQECLEDTQSLRTNTNSPASQSSAGDNARLNRASSLKRDQGTY